jgi:RNA polymerase sigma-70 factor (ECF subfamily)
VGAGGFCGKFWRGVVFLAGDASLLAGTVQVEQAQRMMPQQSLQSGELILAENGEERVTPFDDIAAVHALYEERIFRFLLLSVRDRDVALSLTQDTFLNAWRTRANFRGECSIATWLTYIAANLLRSHTRTETFKFWKKVGVTAVSADDLKAQLPHPERSAESKLIAQAELEQVWKRVEKLSGPQRMIFLLRFVEEAELSEIAKVMNMPVPTVKSHLYRALDHIRAGRPAGSRKKGRR